MAPITQQYATRTPSQHTTKLAARGDGGLQENTKIGIVIGLICFFSLLTSFWYIARWRKRPEPPTAERQFQVESLGRWMDNMGHPANASTNRIYEGPEHRDIRRVSSSTYTTNASQNEGELSRPPHAHLATHL